MIRWTGLWVAGWLVLTLHQTQETQKQSEQSAVEQKPLPINSAENRFSIPANDPDYKIGPQDVLNIAVWKEPDVSRVVPVRPDGKISLPLLSDVQAAGLTPMKLAEAIATELKKYMNEPRVTVIVTEINSRRIYVLGEVARAGSLPLLPNMTVLQAISSCGGLSQFANSKKTYVLRTEAGKQSKIPFNYKDVVSGRKPGENIVLQPGDTIVVP